MALRRGERLRGAPLFAPHPDMTTPLGLSRQHLSYLQEIGSGWFGKVSGAGGGRPGGGGVRTIQGCAPVLCPSPLLPPLVICPLPLSPPSALTSVRLSPAPTYPIAPTSVSRRLPPHSIDHSASPPGSPRVRLSIFPSVPASIGLWARESLTLRLMGDTGGGI